MTSIPVAKKCRLVRFDPTILELTMSNTLTFYRMTQHLLLQTTMSNLKTFYRIFITYVKSRRSSDDFVQKDESSSFSIYEMMAKKDVT